MPDMAVFGPRNFTVEEGDNTTCVSFAMALARAAAVRSIPSISMQTFALM